MFPSPPGSLDLWLLLPELVLIGMGLVLLVLEMFAPRSRAAAFIATVSLLASLMALSVPWQRLMDSNPTTFIAYDSGSAVGAPLTAYHVNLVFDQFALWMKAIVILGSLLATLMAWKYADRFRNPGEFFALLVFATSAATLLCSASDLLMAYLTVEFLSITSYCMAGYLKFQPRSTEASLKYFLYGAITAAVMLYGMSFLYGMTGTTNLYPESLPGGIDRPSFATGISRAMTGEGGAGAGVALIALVLVTVGFGFKIGMAPFHQWVPDVYDGSPLPVMAWLSVASKAAGMAVLVRFFYVAFPADMWMKPVAGLALLTMTWGNLAALSQQNIKRMLAYSSVAHAGYTLMAVAALGTTTPGQAASVWKMYAVPVYLATYVFMNLGALAVVMAVYNHTKSHRIEDYAGLSTRAPGLAWLFVFFALSLAGIPPTAGFWGKFVLFAATIEAQLIWLAIAGFINSVISVYYYWNVIRAMFLMRAASDEAVPSSWELKATLAVAALGTFLIFLFAGGFMRLFGS